MIERNEDIKNHLIAEIADGWIGTRERETTRGELLNIFHERLSSSADTPFCLLFVQYCSKMAEEMSKSLQPTEPWISSPLFPSTNCLLMWERNPQQKISGPIKGSLCIWQKFDGSTALNSGHVGVVIRVGQNGILSIAEANTRGINDNDERGFDGVNLLTYQPEKLDQGELKFKGFLKVW